MTSQKSLQNNFGYAYRTGLRDNALFAVINAGILLFCFCMTPIMTFRSGMELDEKTGQMVQINFSEKLSYLFSDLMLYSRFLVIAALLGVGVLMGIASFRFITGKKTVNVYYSLGIKRTKLFTAKYLSGLTLVGLSVLVPMTVSLCINLAVLGANRYLFTAFAYLVLSMFSLVALSFTVTAAVFATVGTAFEGVLFSGVLLLLPELLLNCLQTFIQKLVLGTPLGIRFFPGYTYYGENMAESLTKNYSAFNPLRYIADGLRTYGMSAGAKGELQMVENNEMKQIAWQMPDFLTPLLWLLVCVALFALGMFLYERRKAEIGGFIGKNRLLNFLATFLVSLYGFSLLYSALEDRGMALAIAVGVLVFCVLWAGLMLLLLRNLRQFVRSLPALAIQLVMVGLLFTFFATGYFGAANKIPSVDSIRSAQISMPYTSYDTEKYIDGYGSVSGLLSADCFPYGNYTTQADLAAICDIHQQLVDAGRTEPTAYNDTFNGVYPVSVRIAYTLKNGKQVLRNYYGVSQSVLDALAALENSDYRKTQLKKLLIDPLEVVEAPKSDGMDGFANGVMFSEQNRRYERYLQLQAMRNGESAYLYNKTLSARTPLTLTETQNRALLDCLYQDLLEQTPADRFHSDAYLGILRYAAPSAIPQNTEMIDGEPVTAVSDAEVAADKVLPPDEGTEQFNGIDAQENLDLTTFYITANMKRTVAFLQAAGYADAFAETLTPKAVYLQPITKRFGSSYMPNMIRWQDDFPLEFRTSSNRTGNFWGAGMYNAANGFIFAPEDMLKISDAETAKNLLAASRLRARLHPADYILLVAYEEGMYAETYVAAADVPAAIQAEATKLPNGFNG